MTNLGGRKVTNLGSKILGGSEKTILDCIPEGFGGGGGLTEPEIWDWVNPMEKWYTLWGLFSPVSKI